MKNAYPHVRPEASFISHNNKGVNHQTECRLLKAIPTKPLCITTNIFVWIKIDDNSAKRYNSSPLPTLRKLLKILPSNGEFEITLKCSYKL